MTLLVKTIKGETPSLIKNNIRLQAIGNIALLPSKCIRELNEAIEATKNNTGTTLILALSYSSKWDIVNAFKNIATRIKSGELEEEDINEEIISNNLTTHLYPNPELLIRTSGEYRLSNFLLWELAYSEFHFTEVLWPDFSQEHLYQAIIDYQSRERRFGKTSEQIVS
jgi:undecaprenyl diphosphate synthase